MSDSKEPLKKKTRSLEEILESTPHTQVDLPSGGLVYDKDNVLSKGRVHIRYLKGEDEEVLLSPSNIKKESFGDILLRRVILEPDVNVKDLTIGDKTYLMLASRISSLGDEYVIKKVECDFCDHEEEDIELKISESIGDAPMIHRPVQEYTNRFKTVLPASEDEVIMKTITGHDLDKFEQMQQKLSNVRQEFSSMHTFSVLIQSSTGLEDGATEGQILKYVRNLPLKDTNHLRKFLSEIRMTPDNRVDYECPNCGTKQEVPISFGFDFFFRSY